MSATVHAMRSMCTASAHVLAVNGCHEHMFSGSRSWPSAPSVLALSMTGTRSRVLKTRLIAAFALPMSGKACCALLTPMAANIMAKNTYAGQCCTSVLGWLSTRRRQAACQNPEQHKTTARLPSLASHYLLQQLTLSSSVRVISRSLISWPPYQKMRPAQHLVQVRDLHTHMQKPGLLSRLICTCCTMRPVLKGQTFLACD